MFNFLASIAQQYGMDPNQFIQAIMRFVETVEHGARTDLVADALLGVDGFAVDLRVEVDVDEVAVLGWAVHAHEGGEALAQGLKAVVHVFVGDLA